MNEGDGRVDEGDVGEWARRFKGKDPLARAYGSAVTALTAATE